MPDPPSAADAKTSPKGMGIFTMLFTVNKSFMEQDLILNPGNVIDLFPTKGVLLKFYFNGKAYLSPPYILKYLREVEEPSVSDLYTWVTALTSVSPTGHVVPHDQPGPDGFHSWLKYLDYL